MSDFRALLDELDALCTQKQKDYGRDSDPLANLRASESFGIPADLGASIRLADKVHRLQSFYLNGEKVHNDSVEDDFKDIAIYALHALKLYRERKAGGEWEAAYAEWVEKHVGEAKEEVNETLKRAYPAPPSTPTAQTYRTDPPPHKPPTTVWGDKPPGFVWDKA